MSDPDRPADPPEPPEAPEPAQPQASRRRNPVVALARKTVVGVVGGTVTLVGVVMIVTPGPALVLIPAGLAIRATEFAWARRWLRTAREVAARAAARAAAVDPAVRRRRRVLATAAALLVVLVVVVLAAVVAARGWPSYVVHGWAWAQGRAPWLPDLPGM